MTTTPDFLPIPPTETATDPIRSTADLQQRWRALMGELGFGERLLRFVFVGPDRRMIKALSDIPVPKNPEPDVIRNLLAALREILAEADAGTTVALLLSRPGFGGVSDADQRWSRMLTQLATEVGVQIEPFFRANDEDLVLVEPN